MRLVLVVWICGQLLEVNRQEVEVLLNKGTNCCGGSFLVLLNLHEDELSPVNSTPGKACQQYRQYPSIIYQTCCTQVGVIKVIMSCGMPNLTIKITP